MDYLVSIIIPTYNRAHLISETLNSIISQTYTNWECIMVDDGSTDNTNRLIKNYCKKDHRFKYYTRPASMQKGANSCRNFGFNVSKGNYVNWFDSDDFMFPDFIKIKLDKLKNGHFDFVISKSILFENNNLAINKVYNYTFDKFAISHFNFVSHKINWLTPDLMIKRHIVDNTR